MRAVGITEFRRTGGLADHRALDADASCQASRIPLARWIQENGP
jgi:hypothetical protein